MESRERDSAAELSPAAQWVIYTIRHVIRDEPLDDALALRHARGLLLEPITGLSLLDEYSALQEALSSDSALSVWRDDPRYERLIAEEAFRGHLRRIVEQMDAMRPWQQPVLRPLDPDRWELYVSGPRVVGAISLGVRKVESRIRATLFPRDTDGVQHQVAVLALRSGREVALVGHWWRDAMDRTAVLTRDRDVSAADLMTELTSGSHFEPGEYEVLD